MTCPAPSIAIPFLITLILAKLLGISLELLMMLYAFFA